MIPALQRETPSQARQIDDATAWSVLAMVLDPEVPVLSVVELGIVRSVEVTDAGVVTVTVTPTYSGCPATEAIAQDIASALKAAGAASVEIRQQLAPAWTTDWLHPDAHEKLRRYGIAAPAHLASEPTQGQAMRFFPRNIKCPRCGDTQVEQLSAFGSTACKALYRCIACREPFEYFKPI